MEQAALSSRRRSSARTLVRRRYTATALFAAGCAVQDRRRHPTRTVYAFDSTAPTRKCVEAEKRETSRFAAALCDGGF